MVRETCSRKIDQTEVEIFIIGENVLFVGKLRREFVVRIIKLHNDLSIITGGRRRIVEIILERMSAWGNKFRGVSTISFRAVVRMYFHYNLMVGGKKGRKDEWPEILDKKISELFILLRSIFSFKIKFPFSNLLSSIESQFITIVFWVVGIFDNFN